MEEKLKQKSVILRPPLVELSWEPCLLGHTRGGEATQARSVALLCIVANMKGQVGVVTLPDLYLKPEIEIFLVKHSGFSVLTIKC